MDINNLSIKDKLELVAINELTIIDFVLFFNSLTDAEKSIVKSEVKEFRNTLYSYDEQSKYIEFTEYNRNYSKPLIIKAFEKHGINVPGEEFEILSFDNDKSKKKVFVYYQDEIMRIPAERINKLFKTIESILEPQPKTKPTNQLAEPKTDQEEESKTTQNLDFDLSYYPFKSMRIKKLFDSYIDNFKDKSLRSELSYIFHFFKKNDFFETEGNQKINYLLLANYLENSKHKDVKEVKNVLDIIKRNKSFYTAKQCENISNESYCRVMNHFEAF